MAKDMSGKPDGKPPITRHPLFPATVALWFGALFGVGSLAIRPALIETLVVAFRVDAAIPAAAPPVGATGQILAALTLAGLGGALGAWLARRIARPRPVVVQRKRGASLVGAAKRSTARNATSATRRSSLASDRGMAPPRQSAQPPQIPGGANILDVSQFDLDGFEEPPLGHEPHREDAGRSAPHSHEAFGRDRPMDAAAGEGRDDVERIRQGAQAFQPLSEAALVPQAHDAAPPDQAPGSGLSHGAMPAGLAETRPVTSSSRRESETCDMPTTTDRFEPGSPPFAMQHREIALQPGIAQEDHAPDDVADSRSVAAEAEQAPLHRLADESADRLELLPPRQEAGSVFDRKPAPGLFGQPLHAQVTNVAWEADGEGERASGASPPGSDEALDSSAEGFGDTAAIRMAAAPLDTLSPVELLERLALSMRRKAAVSTMQVQPHAAAAMKPAPATTGQAQPADQVTAPPIPTIPDALRPVGLDDEIEDHEVLPAVVPPRRIGKPFGNPSQAGAGDDLEHGYSSLLSLSRPAPAIQRFVRIEEPEANSDEIEPMVVFPGKEPNADRGPFSMPASARANGGQDAPSSAAAAAAGRPDPEETDRALRTALANIQRMSGAA